MIQIKTVKIYKKIHLKNKNKQMKELHTALCN